MAFVQIVDFRTSKFDEMRKLEDEWAAAAGPDSAARRVITGADRDDSGRYLQVVSTTWTSSRIACWPDASDQGIDGRRR
jgi:hypothetical protein